MEGKRGWGGKEGREGRGERERGRGKEKKMKREGKGWRGKGRKRLMINKETTYSKKAVSLLLVTKPASLLVTASSPN